MYATQLQSPLVQPYQSPAPIAPVPAQTGGIDMSGMLNMIMPLMSMALVFSLIMPMFKDMTGSAKKE